MTGVWKVTSWWTPTLFRTHLSLHHPFSQVLSFLKLSQVKFVSCAITSFTYGRERGCSVCWGGLGWNSKELRDLLQGLHLQELLFYSYPRCHSPQLLPIIRGTHFLSKPNNKKEETHTTRTLISLPPPLCPPPLQTSRCIFPNLNKYI